MGRFMMGKSRVSGMLVFVRFLLLVEEPRHCNPILPNKRTQQFKAQAVDDSNRLPIKFVEDPEKV